MKLHELVGRKAIVPALKSQDRKGVIQELVTAMKKAYPTEKFAVADLVDAVMKRESQVGSTGLGGGVAIPHAHVDTLKNVIGAFGRASKPVEFNAVDGQPVTLFFLIASPAGKKEAYIQALQKTSAAIRTPNFVKFLRGAKTAKDIEDVFREAEEFAKV